MGTDLLLVGLLVFPWGIALLVLALRRYQDDGSRWLLALVLALGGLALLWLTIRHPWAISVCAALALWYGWLFRKATKEHS